MNYQALFAALELALFGFFFALPQWVRMGALGEKVRIWVLPVVGILLCIIFWIACEYRARNYDYWRGQITKLVRDTDLGEDFIKGNYGPLALPVRSRRLVRIWGKLVRSSDIVAGHWFERGIILLIAAAWVWILCLL